MTKAVKVIAIEEPDAQLEAAYKALDAALTDWDVSLSVRDGRSKPAGAGGTKGQAIQTAISEHPSWTRKEVAEHVGCTVARVGEVARASAGTKSYDSGSDAPDLAASRIETRTGRCEHERAKKTKTGTCKVCPPVSPKLAR